MTSSVLTVLTGAAFGLSLIVAIGAQNLFVLRAGLRGVHVLPVVLVCALSDVVLIAAGVGGLGSIIEAHPGLVVWARVGGAAFLTVYAVLAARRAMRPTSETEETAARGGTLVAAVSTALALTWLNPHVYLDTVVLLGSIATTHGDARWWFGLGAATASLVWFSLLGFGAQFLQPLFSRPAAWRWLDAAVAVVMLVIAATLVAGI